MDSDPYLYVMEIMPLLPPEKQRELADLAAALLISGPQQDTPAPDNSKPDTD